MKLYEKLIGTINVRKPAAQIVVIKDNMQVFNPSESLLLEDGWKEYIPENNNNGNITNKEEVNPIKKLNIKLKEIEDKIIEYDSSENINIFYIHDTPVWLDKATRVGLMLRFNAELESGLIETSLWYNGITFPILLDDATKMLYAIEVYASKCYDNTQKHITNVRALKSIDELENYDYKTGYPEPLRF